VAAGQKTHDLKADVVSIARITGSRIPQTHDHFHFLLFTLTASATAHRAIKWSRLAGLFYALVDPEGATSTVTKQPRLINLGYHPHQQTLCGEDRA
jgi:hypothetical protein